MKLLIDSVLGESPAPEPIGEVMASLGLNSSPDDLLLPVVFSGLLLFLLQGTLGAVGDWGATVVSRGMTYKLSSDLFARQQRRSLLYHLTTRVGELIARVSDDCWSVYKLFDVAVIKPARSVLTIALTIVVMLRIEPLLGVIVVVVAPVMLAASMTGGRELRAAAENLRTLDGAIRSHIQQVLAGMSVVQSFGQEKRAQAGFDDLTNRMVHAQQRSSLMGGLNGLGPGLVMTMGSAVVLWSCGYGVLKGRITIGDLLVFLMYYNALFIEFSNIALIYPALQGLAPSLRRVDEILRVEPEVVDRPDARRLGPVKGSIVFEDVSFGYEAGRPILRGISLEVKPGETVALVGATGAGKSTLAGLIPRFFDPAEGRVLIDGHDLREVQLSSLRSQVALVLQEPFLFPLTIAENIAYGRPDASAAEIEAAARAANAHDFVSRLPQGYDTVIGERGATLSGGERQRLSIARALLKNAPVLILDEPTSALDAGTEALIMQAMRNLVSGRTTLIIAHRLATVQNADRIVVLDNGRMAESGTHQQLITRGGLYARLSALQFGAVSNIAAASTSRDTQA
jgi:ATP-binding cassette subfamily B protein/subfamily B ATP-binding cassette protein MsbA